MCYNIRPIGRLVPYNTSIYIEMTLTFPLPLNSKSMDGLWEILALSETVFKI